MIYYTWLTGIWTFPELASGIIVACLPVSARFYQGIKETKALSRVEITLRSLFGSSIFESRRHTEDVSLDEFSKPQTATPRRLKGDESRYKMIPEPQPLKAQTTTPKSRESGVQQPQACITRTVDFDVLSEPKGNEMHESINNRYMYQC